MYLKITGQLTALTVNEKRTHASICITETYQVGTETKSKAYWAKTFDVGIMDKLQEVMKLQLKTREACDITAIGNLQHQERTVTTIEGNPKSEYKYFETNIVITKVEPAKPANSFFGKR